jgi:hypothetical protein
MRNVYGESVYMGYEWNFGFGIKVIENSLFCLYLSILASIGLSSRIKVAPFFVLHNMSPILDTFRRTPDFFKFTIMPFYLISSKQDPVPNQLHSFSIEYDHLLFPQYLESSQLELG